LQKSGTDIIEFTLIFNRFKTKVYNYVLKMIRNKMASEDIVQNVFLKFYENMNIIRNKNSINFWIFKTARNEVYAYFRMKKVRGDQFNIEDSDDIEIISDYDINSLIEMNETKEIINKELDSMAPEQREVFILKEYGGLSYIEIASVMGIDENLVKSRLYKTRQKLINALSKINK
jgi:RNA polymerase sigma-70 factor, ECF subfamily